MTLNDFPGRAQLVAFEEGLQQPEWALFIITPEWKETLCLKYILANLSASEEFFYERYKQRRCRPLEYSLPG